jgi:Zn-dependent metalloprotease
VVPVVAALGVLSTGCETPIDGVDDDTPPPVTLVVSETWMQNHQGSGGGAADGEVRARIASLQDAIDRLRGETHTGWTGRQDDVTGYLAEVAGGSRPGTPSAFMDDYGPDLFGLDSSTLRFADPDTETVPHVTTTTATQALGEVPVLDAKLVFTGRGTSANTDDLRVTGIRGRVFPGLTVSTTPALTPEQAQAIAAEQAGGTTDGTPRLVVLPTGPGVLAWEVVVLAAAPTGPATGSYYIDATTGDLVDVRPLSAEVAPPVPSKARAGNSASEPDPNSVQVTGKDPLGRDVTAYGLQTGQGVELTDTTTQAWDSVARTGAIQTHDGTGLSNEGQLPGPLVTSPSTTIADPDAIASQAYGHAVLDYWEGLGRDSWDGAGGLLRSTVHFGPNTYCNASFYGGLRQPQMVYGNPCFEDGQQVTGNLVEPDVAAHEVTHGVTNSTAGLLYTGQSGALNESFSDYFGNVIGNLVHGNDSTLLAEDACVGVSAPTRLCPANPDGTLSFRNMLNGNDFDQYLRILNPGERLRLLTGYKQDSGGVHFNSAIWNNALWSIRSRLAQIDGQPGNTSTLARAFDRAVYGALATRLTPTSGFVDARAAVEQVIIDSQLDPVVLRTAREVFDAEKICTGCPTVSELAGDAVSTSPQTQLHPMISGDRIVWLDISANSEWAGHAASTTLGASGAPQLSASDDLWEATFAGNAIATLDFAGRVSRIDESGATTVLDKVENADATQAVGFAGSDAGLAWLSHGVTVKFADPDGTIYEAGIPDLKAGDLVTTIATGGGDVVLGTEGGRVLLWNPGQGGFRQVAKVKGAVYNLATYGGNVFVIEDNQRTSLITAAGQVLGVTERALPFGATMSDEYVVWTEATAPLQAGVVPGGRAPYPETDLFLLSLSTGKIYNLHPAPAQQGFPSISGRQLVWQDATFGGDDVFTAPVPGGL